MLEKLHGVEEKYLDLEAKLSDPDVVSDPEQYLKYAKAHAKLQEIVTVYREYNVGDGTGRSGSVKAGAGGV